MEGITFDSFVATLDKLVTANAHAKSKGDAFKKWCKDNFQLNSRIGYITSQQQTTNRVSEQFRYFDPIVVFVCNPDVKRASLSKYIFERVYPQLKNVAIIGLTSRSDGETPKFTFETLYIFKNDKFSEWIYPYFTNVEDVSDTSKEMTSTFNGSKSDVDISPVIYYGAPGTGKTRYVQEEIYAKYAESNRLFTTFHQSYSYEDFVEGLKPILDSGGNDIKYHIASGVFYKACEKAAILAEYNSLKDCIEDTIEGRANKFNSAIKANKTILLCIDEINRGNVASIFGDLISLIEPSKRLGCVDYELIATLPYSKMPFGVPKNLFIVGTMNTADRSIQLLDSALRRRFRFIELGPDYTAPFKNVKAVNVLKRINARIRSIFNKDYQVGHSYLLNASLDKDIIEAIIFQIIPLLEEYFYNDINKVRFILNERESTRYPFYKIDKEAQDAYLEYLSIEDENEDKSFYYIDETLVNLKDDASSNYLKHLLGEDE